MVTAPVGTAGVPTRRRVRTGDPTYSMSFHEESCERWCNFVRAVSTMGDNRTEGHYCKRKVSPLTIKMISPAQATLERAPANVRK